MRKTRKIIAALSAAAMLCSAFVGAYAQEAIIKNFDNAEIFEATESSGSLEGFWYSVNAKQTLAVEEAPKADKKYEGSVRTAAAETDKAVKLAVQSGSSGEPYAQIETSAFGEGGKVRVAFNAYIASANNASYAPLQITLRTKNNTTSQLVAFRANKNIQINGSLNPRQYAQGSWYYFMIDIDTASKTYDVFMNGSPLYTEVAMNNGGSISFDPTAANFVNRIRIAVNNPQNSTGCSAYFDDIYVGEPYSDSIEELVVGDILMTDDDGNEITTLNAGACEFNLSSDVTYSEKTQPTPVNMYAAVYNNAGMVKQVARIADVIPQADEVGEFTYSVGGKVKFDVQEGDRVKAFLWDDNMQVLTAYKDTIVIDGDYIYFNNFSQQSSAGLSTANNGSGENVYQRVAITNELNDENGYAYKISCQNLPVSGYPFVTVVPSEKVQGRAVNISFKIRMDEGSHPRALSVNGKDALIEFRPTGQINIGGVNNVAQFKGGEWGEYRISADFESLTFEVYCGDARIGGGKLTQTSLDNLRFTTSYNKNNLNAKSTTYLDDIKIYY